MSHYGIWQNPLIARQAYLLSTNLSNGVAQGGGVGKLRPGGQMLSFLIWPAELVEIVLIGSKSQNSCDSSMFSNQISFLILISIKS